jgi:MFS family permease
MISFIVIPSIKDRNYKHSTKLQDIIEGLKYIHVHKELRLLLLLTFINNIFIMGPAIIGIPVFVREVLTADFSIYAQLETSMAAGMIIGSLIFWKAIKRINPVSILLFGIVVDGITFTFLYFANSSFLATLILLIHGIGIPLITVSRTTIIQSVVPDEYRGRLFSMIYMAVMGTTAISIGLTGAILEYIEADILFLIIGLCAASTVFIGLNPVMRKLLVKNPMDVNI